MLSPKMQRTVRVNEAQMIMLSERAHFDHSLSGHLHKRTADSTKWQLRYFVLYQVRVLNWRRGRVLQYWKISRSTPTYHVQLGVT